MVSKKLSVCLWSTLTPIISELAKQNRLKKISGHLWQNKCSQKILFVGKVASRAGAKGQNNKNAARNKLYSEDRFLI